jgi:hypothetical protein
MGVLGTELHRHCVQRIGVVKPRHMLVALVTQVLVTLVTQVLVTLVTQVLVTLVTQVLVTQCLRRCDTGEVCDTRAKGSTTLEMGVVRVCPLHRRHSLQLSCDS